jgi:hypothetical protein
MADAVEEYEENNAEAYDDGDHEAVNNDMVGYAMRIVDTTDTEISVKAHVAKQADSDLLFRLDTACVGGNICNDVNLFDNAKEKNGAAVQGITGHQLQATHSGEVGSIGLTYCVPRAEDSLLSL